MPVYLRPLSVEQIGQIKQRWHDLRYARIDLWRRLGGGSNTPFVGHGDATSSEAERHYQLTKKSLSQLLGQIWMVVPKRPDYYPNPVEPEPNRGRQKADALTNVPSAAKHLLRSHGRNLPPQPLSREGDCFFCC